MTVVVNNGEETKKEVIGYEKTDNKFQEIFKKVKDMTDEEKKKMTMFESVPNYKKATFTEEVQNMFVLTNKPVVYMTDEVAEDIQIIVDQVQDEVGWYCCVKKTSSGNYLLYKTILPEQEVNGATCEITAEGQSKIMMDMVENEQDELFNDMKFWGHSHVNMGVFASGQDDIQIKEFCKNSEDFFIRGIFNKKGDFKIDIYDVINKIIIKDAKLEVVRYPTSEREAFWKNIIDKNVRKLVSSYRVVGKEDNWHYKGGYTPTKAGHQAGATKEEKKDHYGLYGLDGYEGYEEYQGANYYSGRDNDKSKESKNEKTKKTPLEIDDLGYVTYLPEKEIKYTKKPIVTSTIKYPNGALASFGYLPGETKEVDLANYIFMYDENFKLYDDAEIKKQKLAQITRKATAEEEKDWLMFCLDLQK